MDDDERATHTDRRCSRTSVSRNVFATAGERYPEVALDEVHDVRRGARADRALPFGPRHEAELRTVAPVTFVDGKDLFWWGVRTPGASSGWGRRSARL